MLAVTVGRNVDRFVYIVLSVLFLAAGMVMMALLRTDANLLNFSMTTCIVSFVIGSVLGVAGLYTRVGTAEEAFRRVGINRVFFGHPPG